MQTPLFLDVTDFKTAVGARARESVFVACSGTPTTPGATRTRSSRASLFRYARHQGTILGLPNLSLRCQRFGMESCSTRHPQAQDRWSTSTLLDTLVCHPKQVTIHFIECAFITAHASEDRFVAGRQGAWALADLWLCCLPGQLSLVLLLVCDDTCCNVI